MNIAIRTDSSDIIGSGHVMRCLTLANYLRKKGHNIIFICKDHSNNINHNIVSNSFHVEKLEVSEQQSFNDYQSWLGSSQTEDAKKTLEIIHRHSVDKLVVDHYAIDKVWEKEVRCDIKALYVIDDLANRVHFCDYLLDQNYCINQELRYQNLVNEDCDLFIGPQYILFRDEFNKFNKKKHDGTIKEILVYFGANDPNDETHKVIEASKLLINLNLKWTFIIGVNYKNKKNITNSMKNVKIIEKTNEIAKLMRSADLSVGAGGTTIWERCKMGLPSVVTILAENQREVVRSLSKEGIIISLGDSFKTSTKDYVNIIKILCKSKEKVYRMSKKSYKLIANPKLDFLDSFEK